MIVAAINRFKAAQLCAVLALAALLAGCAESSVGAFAYTVQDKFDYKTCDELAAMHKSYSTNIKDLVALQDKAASEPVGNIVGGMTYGPTLTQARADRHMIERSLAAKNCPPAK